MTKAMEALLAKSAKLRDMVRQLSGECEERLAHSCMREWWVDCLFVALPCPSVSRKT